MKKLFSYFTIAIFTLTIPTSCFVSMAPSTSKIVSYNIQPGMTKNEVIGIMGKPYKKGFVDNPYAKEEVFYYKEKIKSPNKVTVVYIENILTFKNNVLVSIEQGDEFNPQAVPNRRDY
ncbi:hypothetical protein EDL98_07915 [Ornithobacterium rhinotracheale]|uniref:hypothetical protein n=1 Tax=Ornithobacterium rhinotracheale TaxID=28251 RepID=UPI00129D0954|nr:hypothetical protein [Ornithobacterium rhinotracheale]MRJ08641.1 hypothetical protein [Ornithobacterium rhinotracheale]MRJ11010.1 hypothetical protein [Ornithobacterium rhinotracheale]UOH76913.1 outer membrane protein assembly factor BamE [Ornithobacterium rhinotracheale]